MFGRTVKAAAAAVLVAGALAACQPMKMGSAAVVGDQRITTAALDQTVRDWDKEFKASPEANQLRQGSGQLPGEKGQLDSVSESEMRGALTLLVTLDVAEHVARDQNITVTPAQIDQTIRSLGGERRVAALTLANGLPVGHMRDLVSFQVLQDTLLRANGADPAGPEGPQTEMAKVKVGELFVRTADRLNVQVNPRYGTYDPKTIAVGPVTYRLSAGETGTGRQPGPGDQQAPQAPEQPQSDPGA